MGSASTSKQITGLNNRSKYAYVIQAKNDANKSYGLLSNEEIVEFYLILKAAGATKALMWKLILLSTVMLVAGYFGEAVYRDQAQIWGLVSGIAYFIIVYEIWMGSASKLAAAAGGAVQAAHKTLCKFVLIGWAIYPIGFMAGTPGWYEGIFGGLEMDVIYNVGDAINKIGFGLVVYNLAVSSK